MGDAMNVPLPPAACYGPDGWQPLEPNPLQEVIGDSVDVEEALGKLGFTAWSGIGVGERSPLGFTVFRRVEAAPQFAIAVFANVGSGIEHVYAQDLPSLMRLLEGWCTVAQASAVTHLLAQLPADEPDLRELLLGRDVRQ